jgi:hypothetical protein
MSRFTLKTVLLSLFLLALLVVPGLSDVVEMKDGTIHVGEVTEETDENVTIQPAEGEAITVPAGDVKDIKTQKDLVKQFKKDLKKAQRDAKKGKTEKLVELIAWAEEVGLKDEAIDALEDLLDKDPRNAEGKAAYARLTGEEFPWKPKKTPAGRYPGSEKAVERAIKHMISTQHETGCWTFGGYTKGDAAGVMTPVNCLVLLANGTTLKTGEHKKAMQRGYAWIKDNVLWKHNSVAPGDRCTTWRYAFCALFLAELQAIEPSAEIKELLQATCTEIQRAQAPSGGWAHCPAGPSRQGYNELAIVSLFAMSALSASKHLGIKIDNGVYKKGLDYLAKCTSGGNINYSPHPNQRGDGPGRTGIGMFIYALDGQQKGSTFKGFEASMTKGLGELEFGHGAPVINFLGAAMGAIQVSPSKWKQYREAAFPKIFKVQKSNGQFDSIPNPKEPRDMATQVGPDMNHGAYTLILSMETGELTFLSGSLASYPIRK